jgi:uncharacterized repeat protein (TIGR01451 family)
VALIIVLMVLVAPQAVFGQSAYDLSVRIVAFPRRVQSGDHVRFQLTVGNRGPGASKPFKVIITPAFGIMVKNVIALPGTVSTNESGRIEVLYNQGLPANERVEINVLTMAIAEPDSHLRLTAAIADDPPSGDTDRENNFDQLVTDVRAPNSPELGVRITDTPDPVTPGDTLSYTILVGNRGTVPLNGVTLDTTVPPDTWFGSITTTQGTTSAPTPGTQGPVHVDLGTLDPGGVATISLRVSVTGEPRSLVVLALEAADNAGRSTSSGELTFVVAEGDLYLAWTHPDEQSGEFAAPREVRFQRARRGTGKVAEVTPADVASVLAGPTESSVTTYKIYSSSQPGVSTSPNNIFATAPANQSSGGAVSTTSGNYYVATACYPNGESTSSNEVSAGAGEPTLSTFEFTDKKITVTGTGFTAAVSVTIDGMTFEKSATVKKQKTKVIQKGKLANGQTVGEYVTSGKTVFLCYENDTGATTCVSVMRQ